MGKELRGALTALALVASGLLLLVSVDFGIPGQPLLQSLRLHVAVGLLLVVVLLGAARGWRRALLFLVVCGASLADAGMIVWRQHEPRLQLAEAGTTPFARIVSFNLLASNTANGPRIADAILASDADIVMLMEAYPLVGERERIEAAYPYRVGCPPGGRCDTALLSRTPLTEPRLETLSRVYPERLALATTTIRGREVHVAAVHVVKPYFDGFSAQELRRLVEVLDTVEGPLIIAGDFNAAPWSALMDGMVRGAGLLPAPFHPATWPVPLGPLGVPIDNAFTRGPLVIERIEAFDDAFGSNHRGLVADVALATSG